MARVEEGLSTPVATPYFGLRGMANKHRSRLTVGASSGQVRAGSRALAWRRPLRFETLENRRLLTLLTVNTLVDENNGVGVGGISLREAVAAAGSGDTINFSISGTINLTGASGGQISIGKSITIQGPGASLLTIKAFDPDAAGTNNGNGNRVFFVNDNASTLAVTLSGLTLTNGDPIPADENDGGGAIRNAENLTLNACVLTGNYASNGGAIFSSANILTLNDCTVSSNAGADGGAILITGGALSASRTTIANNQSSNAGAGILSRSRPVAVVDSTISGNFADEGGGGVYLYGGSLSITGSTISGNTADANHDSVGTGGGIYNATGSITISNCTISGNAAGGGGGGIFSNTIQPVNIKFSTITGNVVGSGLSGGGINSANVANLDGSIIAGNLQGAATRDDVSGTFNARYSLIGDIRSANVMNTGGSLVGTTGAPILAQLGPLANNGGSTLTHTLLSGSPAIDGGDPAAVAGTGGVPQFDQRESPFSRVSDFDGVGGPRIDMGAVEMAISVPALLGDYNLNHAVDAVDYVLWRKTNNTNVSPAYSGADGDGNSTVNANDYAVWRTHFGNASPGAGTASQVNSVNSLESAAPTDLVSDAKISPLDFANSINTNQISDGDVADLLMATSTSGSQGARTLGQSSLFLLLLSSTTITSPAGQATDDTLGFPNRYETHDTVFDEFADPIESTLLNWQIVLALSS